MQTTGISMQRHATRGRRSTAVLIGRIGQRAGVMVGGVCVATVLGAGAMAHAAEPPEYQIFDLGLVDPNDTVAQAFGISPGGVAVGRSIGASNGGFSWTLDGGIMGLANHNSRPFSVANGANDAGIAVGIASTTLTGAGALPVQWKNGVPSLLPMLPGFDVGRAYDVNSGGMSIGSNGGGSDERAVFYSGGTVSQITRTTQGGSIMTTAFGISDDGLIVGIGRDPNNAARNVGFVYDVTTDTAFEVGSLAGDNGAVAFDVSNAGHIVGSSMLNQGAGTPFIWDSVNGMQAIGLPSGTSQGSARGVNSMGWAVGTASGQFAVPFLFDGTETFRLQDLIDAGSGWDLSTNTFSSAMGISDDGTIVGTGLFNGEIRAYAMVVVPTPGTLGAFLLSGLFLNHGRRRRG